MLARIIIISGLICFTAFSCKTKKENAKAVDAAATTTEVSATQTASKTLLASIERTHCYGTCPVYKFMIYSDGSVTYEGIVHVTRIGKYSGKVSQAQLTEIVNFAKEINYLSFKDDYTIEGVMDLPSVITTFQSKKIINMSYESPQGLKDFEKLLDLTMNSIKLKRDE